MASEIEGHPMFAVVWSFFNKFSKQLEVEDVMISDLSNWLSNQSESFHLVDLMVKLMRKTGMRVDKQRWQKHLAKVAAKHNIALAAELQNSGFSCLAGSKKLQILKVLCEMQFDDNMKFKTVINMEESGEQRLKPVGRDQDGLLYWHQEDEDMNVRVYVEDEDEDDDSGWKVICRNQGDIGKLITQLTDEPLMKKFSESDSEEEDLVESKFQKFLKKQCTADDAEDEKEPKDSKSQACEEKVEIATENGPVVIKMEEHVGNIHEDPSKDEDKAVKIEAELKEIKRDGDENEVRQVDATQQMPTVDPKKKGIKEEPGVEDTSFGREKTDTAPVTEACKREQVKDTTTAEGDNTVTQIHSSDVLLDKVAGPTIAMKEDTKIHAEQSCDTKVEPAKISPLKTDTDPNEMTEHGTKIVIPANSSEEKQNCNVVPSPTVKDMQMPCMHATDTAANKMVVSEEKLEPSDHACSTNVCDDVDDKTVNVTTAKSHEAGVDVGIDISSKDVNPEVKDSNPERRSKAGISVIKFTSTSAVCSSIKTSVGNSQSKSSSSNLTQIAVPVIENECVVRGIVDKFDAKSAGHAMEVPQNSEDVKAACNEDIMPIMHSKLNPENTEEKSQANDGNNTAAGQNTLSSRDNQRDSESERVTGPSPNVTETMDKSEVSMTILLSNPQEGNAMLTADESTQIIKNLGHDSVGNRNTKRSELDNLPISQSVVVPDAEHKHSEPNRAREGDVTANDEVGIQAVEASNKMDEHNQPDKNTCKTLSADAITSTLSSDKPHNEVHEKLALPEQAKGDTTVEKVNVKQGDDYVKTDVDQRLSNETDGKTLPVDITAPLAQSVESQNEVEVNVDMSHSDTDKSKQPEGDTDAKNKLDILEVDQRLSNEADGKTLPVDITAPLAQSVESQNEVEVNVDMSHSDTDKSKQPEGDTDAKNKLDVLEVDGNKQTDNEQHLSAESSWKMPPAENVTALVLGSKQGNKVDSHLKLKETENASTKKEEAAIKATQVENSMNAEEHPPKETNSKTPSADIVTPMVLNQCQNKAEDQAGESHSNTEKSKKPEDDSATEDEMEATQIDHKLEVKEHPLDETSSRTAFAEPLTKIETEVDESDSSTRKLKEPKDERTAGDEVSLKPTEGDSKMDAKQNSPKETNSQNPSADIATPMVPSVDPSDEVQPSIDTPTAKDKVKVMVKENDTRIAAEKPLPVLEETNSKYPSANIATTVVPSAELQDEVATNLDLSNAKEASSISEKGMLLSHVEEIEDDSKMDVNKDLRNETSHKTLSVDTMTPSVLNVGSQNKVATNLLKNRNNKQLPFAASTESPALFSAGENHEKLTRPSDLPDHIQSLPDNTTPMDITTECPEGVVDANAQKFMPEHIEGEKSKEFKNGPPSDVALSSLAQVEEDTGGRESGSLQLPTVDMIFADNTQSKDDDQPGNVPLSNNASHTEAKTADDKSSSSPALSETATVIQKDKNDLYRQNAEADSIERIISTEGGDGDEITDIAEMKEQALNERETPSEKGNGPAQEEKVDDREIEQVDVKVVKKAPLRKGGRKKRRRNFNNKKRVRSNVTKKVVDPNTPKQKKPKMSVLERLKADADAIIHNKAGKDKKTGSAVGEDAYRTRSGRRVRSAKKDETEVWQTLGEDVSVKEKKIGKSDVDDDFTYVEHKSKTGQLVVGDPPEKEYKRIVDDDTPCMKCGLFSHPETILLCDGCNKGHHMACLTPPLMLIPDADWFCPTCSQGKLIERLKEIYKELGSKLKLQERKTRQSEYKKLLNEYTGISATNILENNKPPKPKPPPKRKRWLSPSESELSEEEYSSPSSPEMKTRRCRTKQVSYDFSSFDKTIMDAIKDDIVIKPEVQSQRPVSGKDIRTIIAAEKGEDVDLDDKEISPGKRRKRKLTNLNSSESEAADSGSNYSVSSSNEEMSEEEFQDPEDSESESFSEGGVGRRGLRGKKRPHILPTKRSRRLRKKRIREDYETSLSESSSDYEDQAPKKKAKRKKRNGYGRDSTEDTDEYVPSHIARKKHFIVDDDDGEEKESSQKTKRCRVMKSSSDEEGKEKILTKKKEAVNNGESSNEWSSLSSGAGTSDHASDVESCTEQQDVPTIPQNTLKTEET